MPGPLLVQLPLNPSAAFEATGNTPLAPGMLAASAGLQPGTVLDQDVADRLGDRALARHIAALEPEIVGFTLYCWNAERSRALAGELKQLAPGVMTIGGGPEVQPDNAWLRSPGAFDLLVAGEGEPLAASLLDPASLRARLGAGTDLVDSGMHDFAPGAWPDPWLEGHLSPGRSGSVPVETVRGCGASCIYCSYRRRHPRPRRMPAQAAAGLCRELAARGASEIVFLDPTFNARPDLRVLLEGMSGAGVECFAELRAESVTAGTASLLAGAGFTGVEVGLQTWDSGVLERSGRPGSPGRVLEGARRLTDAGVKTTIDLILGLPGDTPAGPLEAADRMVEAGLSENAQVFFASVLPGTGLRDRASELGIEWMDRPPYYATRSGAFDFEDLARAREQIADLFGYDLEIAPRPLMCDDAEGMERFDLDADGAVPVEDLPPPPSARHGVLRLSGRNLGRKADLLVRHIRRRTSADPFSVLDVILEPLSPVTPALVRRLRTAAPPNDYSSRVAALHGIDGNLRLSVNVADWRAFPEEGLLELAASCPVAVEAGDPSDLPGRLLERDLGIRLPPGHDLTALSRRVPLTDRVYFSSTLDERLWTSAILGL